MNRDDPRDPYQFVPGEVVTGEVPSVDATAPSVNDREGRQALDPVTAELEVADAGLHRELGSPGISPSERGPIRPVFGPVRISSSPDLSGAGVPSGPDEVDFGSVEDDLWPVRGPAKGVRLPVPAAILLVLLVAAGGIWGGAALQRAQGSSAATTFSAARLAFSHGAAGAGAFSRFASGPAAGATTGTVTVIDGSTLYITNAAGNIVKVTLTPSTTITRDATATAADLRPGDTVVIEGATAKNGTVAASSIAATAAGVTPSVGGFGG